MDRDHEAPNQASLRVLPCACANIRRAARAVTRLYNQALRGEGIEVTQFTLLMALEITGETTQGTLGDLLALDSTTLTRTLKLLTKKKWIQIREGQDRRQRLVMLTAAGLHKLHHAMPKWAKAQAALQKAMGREAFAQLGGLSAGITAASLAS